MIDIQILFTQIFGIAVPKVWSVRPDFDQMPTKDALSKLGMPYYHRTNNVSYFMPVKLNNVWMPYPVLSMECSKQIVQTSLVKQNGSVKELINTGDWNIRLQGLIVGDGVWPEEQVQGVVDVFRVGESVSIESVVTQLLLTGNEPNGTNQVVITRIGWPARPGTEHVVPYEIEMVSDRDFELIIE